MCFAQAKGVSVAEKGLDVFDNPKAALGALSVNSVSGEGVMFWDLYLGCGM